MKGSGGIKRVLEFGGGSSQHNSLIALISSADLLLTPVWPGCGSFFPPLRSETFVGSELVSPLGGKAFAPTQLR